MTTLVRLGGSAGRLSAGGAGAGGGSGAGAPGDAGADDADVAGSAADPGRGQIDATRPLGVYVHFPFCAVRCPYCDFAVDTRAPVPHDEYADAVVAELVARAPWFARGQPGRSDQSDQSDQSGRGGRGAADAGDGAPLASIYFGGGTPGLWRPDALARVLEAARATFATPAPASVEITVESNPGDVDTGALEALRRAGVNRLSFGVQAFDDGLLRGLGRNHDAAAARAALPAARAAGFDNLCADLMFALPGQTLDDWRRALEQMIALGPEHISAYALTVERGTPFGALDRAGRLPRPGDDEAAGMFETAHEALTGAGYEHYEVSSYARPGRRSVHNQLYWSGGAYLGVGASAASFRPLDDGSGLRFTNPRATMTYLRAVAAGGPAPAKVERRTCADLEAEALWLALRTSDGVDRALHAARFGADALAGRADAAARCVAAGWLEVAPGVVRLTRAGFLVADEVVSRLWAASSG